MPIKPDTASPEGVQAAAEHCRVMHLDIFRCHPSLRAYGDAGIAIFVLSSLAATLQVFLTMNTMWCSTCDARGYQVRAATPLLRRVTETFYMAGFVVYHLIVVYGSMLEPTIIAPQLPIETIVVWTSMLLMGAVLLAASLCDRDTMASAAFANRAIHSCGILMCLYARLDAAQLAPDLGLPLFLLLYTFGVLFHAPKAFNRYAANLRRRGSDDYGGDGTKDAETLFATRTPVSAAKRPDVRLSEIERGYADAAAAIDAEAVAATAFVSLSPPARPPATRAKVGAVAEESRFPFIQISNLEDAAIGSELHSPSIIEAAAAAGASSDATSHAQTPAPSPPKKRLES